MVYRIVTVDLYIPTYKWAIEILIDGIEIGEHYRRFKKGNFINIIFGFIISKKLINLNNILLDGKYSNIPINSFMLIDIRQEKKIKAKNLVYKNTWHITPSKDFRAFNVVGKNITEFNIFVHNNNKRCPCNKTIIFMIENIYELKDNQKFLYRIIIFLTVLFALTFIFSIYITVGYVLGYRIVSINV